MNSCIAVDGVAMPLIDGFVQQRIVNQQPGQPLVRTIFVGEGNFTFSTAFASLRGSWTNIIATDKDLLCPSYRLPLLYYVTVLNNIRNVLRYSGEPLSLEERFEIDCNAVEDVIAAIKEWLVNNQAVVITYREYIHAIVNLPPTVFIQCIDATRLNRTDFFNTGNGHPCAIFFQCPYVGYQNGETQQFVQEFISSASAVQLPGDLLFIGITTQSPYCNNYGLWKIIGEHRHADEEGYHFDGADKDFPLQMLRRGYKHSGFRDIHDVIINDHVTLCFTKQSVPCKPMEA